MITSLMVSGEYKIELDKNEKLTIDGNKIGIREIPVLRYRFEEYTEKSFEYIKNMKEIFKHSVHLVQFYLSENTVELVSQLNSIVDGAAVYIYIPVTDDIVEGGFTVEQSRWMDDCSRISLDRVMLKDDSTSLHLIQANKLKKEVSNKMSVPVGNIGLCQSPLSFNSGEACVTAAIARHLASIYLESDEGAIPSSNHESMSKCGCIRYLEIDSDVSVSEGSTAKSKKSIITNKAAAKTKLPNKFIPKFGAKH